MPIGIISMEEDLELRFEGSRRLSYKRIIKLV